MNAEAEAQDEYDREQIAERSFTYEDMRVAFASGFASCQDHMDADDAWDEHRAFLATTKAGEQYVWLIVSEGDGGTHVTAHSTKEARDAAYVAMIEEEYGGSYENADEAWAAMDANVSRTDWNCYTTSAQLED
jgi:hypothetical protein